MGFKVTEEAEGALAVARVGICQQHGIPRRGVRLHARLQHALEPFGSGPRLGGARKCDNDASEGARVRLEATIEHGRQHLLGLRRLTRLCQRCQDGVEADGVWWWRSTW